MPFEETLRKGVYHKRPHIDIHVLTDWEILRNQRLLRETATVVFDRLDVSSTCMYTDLSDH